MRFSFESRCRIVALIVEGESPQATAAACGASRATGYRLWRRFREGGWASLADRPSIPRCQPRRLAPAAEQEILHWRHELGAGPAVIASIVQRPPSTVGKVLRRAEALLALANGRAEEALAHTEEAIGARTELGIANHAVKSALVAGLEAAFALGDESKADELLSVIDGLPLGELTPHLRAVGARFGAHRAATRGDGEAASAGFSAAARIFEEIERPFDLAVVRLEHAEWLAEYGRFEDPEPLLEEACGIFERLGATPWLERLATVEVGQPALVP